MSSFIVFCCWHQGGVSEFVLYEERCRSVWHAVSNKLICNLISCHRDDSALHVATFIASRSIAYAKEMMLFLMSENMSGTTSTILCSTRACNLLMICKIGN